MTARNERVVWTVPGAASDPPCTADTEARDAVTLRSTMDLRVPRTV